jgi:HSP20 family protein
MHAEVRAHITRPKGPYINMAIRKKATPKGESKRIIPDDEAFDLQDIDGERMQKTQEDGQLSVDVFQTPEEIVVVAPMAGVKMKDVWISLNALTIRGHRPLKFNVKPESYFTEECFWGNFSRSVILPEAVDTGQINAHFSEGILVVKVPKVAKVRTRTITIQEEE